MSNNNQYLDMFFAESRDYIQILNDSILLLEQNPDDKEVINSLFRAAHSMKGMAATMGFNTLTELTHKLENILDMIRNDRISVDTELIDILFAGIDHIENIVKQIKEEGNEDTDLSSFLQILEERIKNPGSKNSEAESTETVNGDVLKLTGQEIKSIQANKKESDVVYNIRVFLDRDTEFKQARVSMIYKAVSDIGYIVKSDPEQDKLAEAELRDDIAKMILISKQAQEDIKEEIMNISDIENVDINIIKLKKLESDLTEKDGNTIKSNLVSSKFEVSSTVRVDINKLDKLMNMIGELLINKTRLQALNIKSEGFKEVLPQLDRVTMELHHTVMQIRMEPIGVMFNRFPRMIRDLAKEENKEIDFIMEGKETELDRSIIDELGDPITHLLRNAVDHGIESPVQREKTGKNKEGEIYLRAYQKGSEIIIEVEDDGHGIDIDKLVEKALEKDIVTQENVEDMDEHQKLQLLFEPGISTSEEISDISGRGVGMDVVKRTIESLDGEIYIESEKGKGTKFTISLPLTLAIQEALMVKINNEIFAIPLNAISETLKIKTKEIKQVKGNDVIVLRNKTIPLIDSRKSLNLDIDHSQYKDKKEIPVVIIKSGGKEIGLIIDELLYQQEIVIKSLGNYFNNIKSISGATIIGDGEVALILDVRDIA